jgi:hypothetical protein
MSPNFGSNRNKIIFFRSFSGVGVDSFSFGRRRSNFESEFVTKNAVTTPCRGEEAAAFAAKLENRESDRAPGTAESLRSPAWAGWTETQMPTATSHPHHLMKFTMTTLPLMIRFFPPNRAYHERSVIRPALSIKRLPEDGPDLSALSVRRWTPLPIPPFTLFPLVESLKFS